MKIVIDIPENRYKEIVSGLFYADNYFKTNLTLAFRNGTPLPKGHGKIGDLDVARGKIKEYQELIRNTSKLTLDKALDLILLGRCVELIDKVKPIIEADKAESEE